MCCPKMNAEVVRDEDERIGSGGDLDKATAVTRLTQLSASLFAQSMERWWLSGPMNLTLA